MTSLGEAALGVLGTSDATDKAKASLEAAIAWHSGSLVPACNQPLPDRPARPDKPDLLPPGKMLRRRAGKDTKNRIALLHAIAHIELNAIDLAWDMVARFGDGMPTAFLDDWVGVANDEAKHFSLLEERLNDLGSFYGALPAHDGLWQAALETKNNLLARLAIVPLVLEARGLDVTPGMITRFESYGDRKTASLLQIIYDDEIGHVRAGARWFLDACDHAGMPPEGTYQALVKEYFSGQLKPPFNTLARTKAGLPEAFYAPIAAK